MITSRDTTLWKTDKRLAPNKNHVQQKQNSTLDKKKNYCSGENPERNALFRQSLHASSRGTETSSTRAPDVENIGPYTY